MNRKTKSKKSEIKPDHRQISDAVRLHFGGSSLREIRRATGADRTAIRRWVARCAALMRPAPRAVRADGDRSLYAILDSQTRTALARAAAEGRP